MLHSNSVNDLRSAYPGEYKPASQFRESFYENNPSQKMFQDIEIFEDEHYFKINFAAPGLTREDLLVSINKPGNLVINGMHKFTKATQRETSIRYTGFRRELALPPNIDTDFVKAEFRDSVLSICFLKTTNNYNKRESTVAVY